MVRPVLNAAGTRAPDPVARSRNGGGEARSAGFRSAKPGSGCARMDERPGIMFKDLQ
jgi:hypothetical protein